MSSKILDASSVSFTPIAWTEFGPGHDEMLYAPRRNAQPATSPASEPAIEGPDLDLLREQAREQGRREAEAAARDAAMQETAALHRRLAQSIEALATLRPRLRVEAERQVVELSIAIARRILRRQITIDPDAVAGLVRSALDDLSLRDVLSVRCHPACLAPLQATLQNLGAPPSVRLEPDPSLEQGGIVIETSAGLLDASVTTQLEEIERGFTDLIEAPAKDRR
jgi:flagellar assembly protein FliH